MAAPEGSMDKGLTTRDLSIAYGSSIVVRNVALAIPPRSFTALVGPNGSGKSTLLRSLAGLLKPRAGAVMLDGTPLADLSARATARRIGVLAQGPRAPEGLTVRELAEQGRYAHRPFFGRWSPGDEAACREALRLTGMTEFAPRPLDSLSGGQRQRAWIAMALAQETDILLLDEPTTYLDLAHQIDVMELIRDLVLQRGKTVVAVLHDLNHAARYADHMVMLKEGTLVVTGMPREVMTAEAVLDVFGVAAQIFDDPVSGAPMCIPLGRAGHSGIGPQRAVAGDRSGPAGGGR